MNIYLDIETIPTQREDLIADIRSELAEELAAITAPSNYKDEAKIAEYLADKAGEMEGKFDDKYRATALDGAMGEICCIGWAFDDEAPDSLSDRPEPVILRNLFTQLEDRFQESHGRRMTFIGHNIVDFDLRFIRQRAIINGIKPPDWVPFDAKPWETDRVFDTMVQWAGLKRGGSLNKLCKVMGITQKGDLDGSKVWDYYKAGRISEIALYCRDDVERVRKIYKRMTFQ